MSYELREPSILPSKLLGVPASEGTELILVGPGPASVCALPRWVWAERSEGGSRERARESGGLL